jgi:hypothetical protein
MSTIRVTALLTRLLWLFTFLAAPNVKAETFAQCESGAGVHPILHWGTSSLSGNAVYSGQHITLRITLPDPNRNLSELRVDVDGTPALHIGPLELLSYPKKESEVEIPIEIAVGQGHKGQLILPANKQPNLSAFAYDDGNPHLCGHRETGLQTADARPFAIVVGFNYVDSGFELKWAQRDAKKVVEHLLSRVGVPSENIYYLTDDEKAKDGLPTDIHFDIKPEYPTDISTAFQSVYQRADWSSTLYFYFSGHEFAQQGLRYLDGFYLMMWNSDASEPSTMYPRRFLYQLLAPVNHLLTISILDACFSGPEDTIPRQGISESAAPISPRRKIMRAPYVDLDPVEPGVVHGVRIASSKGNAISWEFDALNHGVFTFHLLHATDSVAKLSIADAFATAKRATESYQPAVDTNLSPQKAVSYSQSPMLNGYDEDGLLAPWSVKADSH